MPMWYRDIAEDLPAAAAQIEEYFDCDALTADTILEQCAIRHKRGAKGLPFAEGFRHESEYYDVREIAYRYLSHLEVDPREVARLLYDAWIDGIQGQSRLTVYLDNQSTDGVTASVHGAFAELWAEHQQSIDGSSWECDPVYTMLVDRPGLVSDLRAEGYELDLTEYCE
jgi:hypothetical protein